MFARNNEKDPRGFDAPKPAQPPSIPANAGPTIKTGTFDKSKASVIGSDLTIIGQGLKVLSKGMLQIDGEIAGDVLGTEIVIGDDAKVTGLVNAEKVMVRGTVNGTIRALHVTLASHASVEGDIHHQTLTIEQGAMFEGKSRRPQDTTDLVPNLDYRAHTLESGAGSVKL